jgi:hypothetical protein
MPRTHRRKPYKQRYRSRKRRSFLDTFWGPWVVLIGIALCIWVGVSDAALWRPALTKVTGLLGLSEGQISTCDIKGNISIRTGERIYHIPGQEYYSATRISASKGERWFCSEAEARSAGWRRSRR